MSWWTEKVGTKRAGQRSIFDPPPPGACRPGRQHRWTVMSSRRGWINCYWCPASKRQG